MVADGYIENGFIDSRYCRSGAAGVAYVVDEGEGEGAVSCEGAGSSRHFARSSLAWSEGSIGHGDRLVAAG